MVSAIQSSLRFGRSGFTMGQNPQSTIALHGLNPNDTSYIQGSNLEPFAPVVAWHDQRNSVVQYDSTGNIATTCSGGYTSSGTPTIDSPCSKPPTGSEQMNLQATPSSRLYGTIYMPRGSFLDLQGGGVIDAPLRIITGAVNLGGTPDLTLTSTSDPVRRRIVALVE
jgi:hypothetical protein